MVEKTHIGLSLRARDGGGREESSIVSRDK